MPHCLFSFRYKLGIFPIDAKRGQVCISAHLYPEHSPTWRSLDFRSGAFVRKRGLFFSSQPLSFHTQLKGCFTVEKCQQVRNSKQFQKSGFLCPLLGRNLTTAIVQRG